MEKLIIALLMFTVVGFAQPIAILSPKDLSDTSRVLKFYRLMVETNTRTMCNGNKLCHHSTDKWVADYPNGFDVKFDITHYHDTVFAAIVIFAGSNMMGYSIPVELATIEAAGPLSVSDDDKYTSFVGMNDDAVHLLSLDGVVISHYESATDLISIDPDALTLSLFDGMLVIRCTNGFE